MENALASQIGFDYVPAVDLAILRRSKGAQQVRWLDFRVAGVAQLVRAPVCGTGGRRFETGHSPHFLPVSKSEDLASDVVKNDRVLVQ